MTEALVLVTSSFPIRHDGSEAAGSFVADFVEELSLSVPVRVVAPGPAAAHEYLGKQIEIYRYAAPRQALSTLKPWRPQDMRWIARVLRGGLVATQRAVESGGSAAHILALWGLPCGEWARRVAHKHRLNYSVWLLGSDVWSLGHIPVVRGYLARVIRQARHAYADGYKLAEDGQQIACQNKEIRFLPSTRKCGLKAPPPPRRAAPYRLLFLGRWHHNKGIDLLLEALELLDDNEWRRIESVGIQGGGPMETLVRERCERLRAAGRPVADGRYLSKPEAEAAIAHADWVLIPSRIESIPVVFSDAMKLGRPVIAAPVGDLPALLGGKACGVLASGTDAPALSRALKSALEQSPHKFSAGVTAAKTAFELDFVSRKLLADITDHG